jgi:Xaa-Pro aminopeptidase
MSLAPGSLSADPIRAQEAPVFLRLVLTIAIGTLCASDATAQIPQAEYAQRRQALADRLPDGVLVAFGAREPAHDYLPFAQASNFRYLTGITEPNAALVMVKTAAGVQSTLFVRARNPAREIWEGYRLGAEGATRHTGLPARPYTELSGVLDSLARAALSFHVIGDLGEQAPRSPDQQEIDRIRAAVPALRVADAGPHVRQLRGRKSAAELDLLRRAIEITVIAHREAMRAIEPGMNEFEIQALIEYTFRRNGADRPAFASIVGSGPNSTTLHYNENDRYMERGDVVVIDIGASYRGYAADITRTLPVSGTFTQPQREIYQLVLDAQLSAERQARPGAPARLMEDSSFAVLARGLARLGLIDGPDAVFDAAPGGCRRALREGCSQVSLFYMHGLGHGIGLDVHDPDQYSSPPNTLQAGSAFTIEPGIYVRTDVFDHLPNTQRNRQMIARRRPTVERYMNIGVRIEDDYIISDQGLQRLSNAPREIDEIEALMRETFSGPRARDPRIVEWYRETVERP